MRKVKDITKSEMVAITNAVTGEIETAKVTIHIQKDKPKYKDKFTIFFQTAGLTLVREIKPITTHLLFYMNSVCQYGNIVDRTVLEMAEDIGYKKNQVLKGLKQLYELNIIIKIQHKDDARRNIIMINPAQSWKGKPIERAKALSKLTNSQQLSLFNDTQQHSLLHISEKTTK